LRASSRLLPIRALIRIDRELKNAARGKTLSFFGSPTERTRCGFNAFEIHRKRPASPHRRNDFAAIRRMFPTFELKHRTDIAWQPFEQR
jgi:hypothetical protein